FRAGLSVKERETIYLYRAIQCWMFHRTFPSLGLGRYAQPSLAAQKCVDVVGELLWILIEKPMASVRVDPQLGVGQMVGAEIAVLGDHHRIVVPVRHQYWHRDRCQASQLGGIGYPPARNRLELGVPRCQVSRRVTLDRSCRDALEKL